MIRQIKLAKQLFKFSQQQQSRYLFSEKKSSADFKKAQEESEDQSDEARYTKAEEEHRQHQRRQFQQNRLKFIALTASLGGSMIGYCIASYVNFYGKGATAGKNEEQEQNNLMNFKGEWNSNWDGLQHISDKEKELELQIKQAKEQGVDNSQNTPQIKKRGTRYIYLVRHGQYIQSDNEEGKKLSDLGKKQAKVTAKRLKELDIKFDKVYVSNIIRAKETCDIIAKELNFKKNKIPVIEDPDLAEGFPAPCHPSNKQLEELIQKYKEEDDEERISRGFTKYMKRIGEDEQEGDSHELYVIHGNVIRYFLCRALQFPVEGWLRMGTANCGMTQLQISKNGNVVLKRFGESGHLSNNQVTFN